PDQPQARGRLQRPRDRDRRAEPRRSRPLPPSRGRGRPPQAHPPARLRGRPSRPAERRGLNGEGTMANGNVVELIGNITRDPELRFTPSGAAVANFGLAVNRRWRNQQTNEWEE